MIIGEVVGTVVATRKTDNVQGLPLRLVRKLTITTGLSRRVSPGGKPHIALTCWSNWLAKVASRV